MANPLLPANRTTPINAYVALRSHGWGANILHVRGVTQSTTRSGPQNGEGISSAKLGGSASLQALGSF